MKAYTTEQILEMIQNRNHDEQLDLADCLIEGADMAGWDLTNINFEWTHFLECDMTNADFTGSNLNHIWFEKCQCRGVKFTNCDVQQANFRWMDFTGADFSGANFYYTLFEYTTLDDVTDSDDTKYFRMVCPETGPFIAWKCCTDLRVVQLLVPADARRVSATADTCRCDKAKVLSIKSIDETVSYDWAQSTVDPDFYYEVGKWVTPANEFQPDRWMDSSPGIHFFMERQQCVDYQAK